MCKHFNHIDFEDFLTIEWKRIRIYYIYLKNDHEISHTVTHDTVYVRLVYCKLGERNARIFRIKFTFSLATSVNGSRKI